ncbi:MAG: DUF4386 family protein [Chloroflexi bacterium]|nr:DUF4386 family protein [Chloroflexota bacterium]
MSNRNLYRIGLVAAIISTVGWIFFVLGNMSSPDLPAIADPQQYFQTLQGARSTYLLYGWGGVIGAFLTIPYILAFFYATENAGSVRSVATSAAVIGAVLTAAGFMSNTLSPIYFILPVALETDPEALLATRIAVELIIDAFEAMWWVGSFLVYGVGIGSIAIHAWQSTSAPKWINGVGIVAGLTGIIWLRHFIPFLLPLTRILSLLNILTASIWAIALSAWLTRQD